MLRIHTKEYEGMPPPLRELFLTLRYYSVYTSRLAGPDGMRRFRTRFAAASRATEMAAAKVKNLPTCTEARAALDNAKAAVRAAGHVEPTDYVLAADKAARTWLWERPNLSA